MKTLKRKWLISNHQFFRLTTIKVGICTAHEHNFKIILTQIDELMSLYRFVKPFQIPRFQYGMSHCVISVFGWDFSYPRIPKDPIEMNRLGFGDL